MSVTSTDRQICQQLESYWQRLCGEQGTKTPSSWQVSDGDIVPMAQLPGTLAADDALARRLVRCAQAADQLAGAALILAMLPRLRLMAHQDLRHELSDYIAVAWVRLVSVALPNLRQAVVARLALDTMKVVRGSSRRHRREVHVSTVPEPTPARSSAPTQTELPSVHEVIDLAARRQLVSSESIGVLRSVYADGLTGQEAAAKHGITATMVRYRCSRGLAVLRQNRQLLLSA